MASMMLADCSSTSTARLTTLRRQNNVLHLSGRVSFPIKPTNISLPSASVQSRSSPMLVSAALAAESSVRIIDGKSVAKQIREEIAVEISRMKETIGVVPGLAVILVGDRKDSATYVRNKKKACESAGINSFEVHLPENSTEQEVLDSISKFNHDPSVHGILVQLPLPSHMNEEKILNAVGIKKDVDGFHPLSIGRLAMRDREPLFVPCTPKGCLELLHRYGVEIKGKRAVVIGRSNHCWNARCSFAAKRRCYSHCCPFEN